MKTKLLKYPLLLLTPLLPLSAAVQTFDGLIPDSPLTNVPGWSLSEANPSSAPLAWVGLLNGSTAGALGGEFTDPTVSPVKLTFSSSVMDSSAGVAFNFLVKDSTSAVPTRDAFGFSVANGSGATLVSVFLTPVFQAITPELDAAQWDFSYRFAGGGLTPSSVVINEQSLYNMNFTFNGELIDIILSNTLSSRTFSGSVAGFDGAVAGVGDVSFSWDKSSPSASTGDNYILIDNLAVVPETSSVLMSGLAALLVLARRRRN